MMDDRPIVAAFAFVAGFILALKMLRRLFKADVK